MSNKSGRRLKAFRDAKGMTQLEVADAIGVSHSTIQKWENGAVSEATAKNLFKLGAILDFDVSELFK